MSTRLDEVVARDAEEAPPRRRPIGAPWVRGLALGLLVVLDLVVPIAFAYRASLIFPTFHVDGAFQTASGLLRLSGGELPGRDFLPYLGIGPLLLLLPAFLLAGADVTASVFSAHLVTLLALQLVFVVLAALVLGRRSPWALALAAGVPMVLFIGIGEWPSLAVVDQFCGQCLSVGSLPGNSLRPVRALAPYLLAALAYWLLTRHWGLVPKLAVAGVASGVVAALWSNDYGLVSGGLMVAVLTGYVVRSPESRRVRDVAVLWGAAAGGALVAGFAVTGGHFLAYLHYNLVDVRGDQFWYYGGWGAGNKVYSVGDLLGIMSREGAVFPTVVLAAVLVWAVRTRALRWLFAGYLGSALLLGGLAGTIGGHASEYFWAFRIWGHVLVLMAVVGLVSFGLSRLGRNRATQDRRRTGVAIHATLAAVLVVALLLAGAASLNNARELRALLAADPYVTYDARLGSYLDARFEEHVRLVSEPGADVLEEYMGLAGSVRGPRTDLTVDSVIHALGDQRAAFAARMTEPHDMVVTTVPELDQFVSWGIGANWWFYRELFRAYRPAQTSPNTIVWTPAEPQSWTPVECRVGESGLELDTPTAGFYEVTVQYRGPGQNARAFTMLQNNINFAVGANGYLALDPSADSQQVPVYVREVPASGVTSLSTQDVRGGDDDDPLTEFLGCSASAVVVPDGAETVYLYAGLGLTDAAFPYQPTPVRLTDGVWIDGVHRFTAAFFVRNSAQNLDGLTEATEVRFSDGETRRIEEVRTVGGFIEVYLEGDPLDPETAGYPNVFELQP